MDLTLFPPHVRNLSNYAWKACVIRHAAESLPCFLFLDAGMELRDSVADIQSKVRNHGGWFVTASNGRRYSTLAGVVHPGARNASSNGMRMAETLAAELAVRHPIVSGLARGIDAAAHTGAMRSGRTVAVIAGGLDVPYPPENAVLQARIAANGAVVAEAPLGTAPQGRHFPKRNRIIAGLVLGLVVVEAAARSGSLLTARLANEAGRELFGVPGSPLDPRSAGANDLIRQGAHLTETAADVLANLPSHPGAQGLARDPLFRRPGPGFAEPPAPWSEPRADAATMARARREIPPLLGADPVAVDEIARRCQLSNAAVLAVLLEIELAGRVETLPGNRVVRI